MQGGNVIGRICEILIRSSGSGPSATLVMLEKFLLHSECHPSLGMPTIAPVEDGKCCYEVVASTVRASGKSTSWFSFDSDKYPANFSPYSFLSTYSMIARLPNAR